MVDLLWFCHCSKFVLEQSAMDMDFVHYLLTELGKGKENSAAFCQRGIPEVVGGGAAQQPHQHPALLEQAAGA